MERSIHHQIVIVGGGAAGLSVAARLTKGWRSNFDVAVIEPSDKHFYQPLWTLVGGGVVSREKSVRSETSVMPRNVTWIQDAVAEIRPESNSLVTRFGQTVAYDWLVVAAGIQLNWDKIPGLKESLGTDGVCSNYSFKTVNSTWESIRNFRGGNAVFTHPSGAVKCGGAPQKIMYLADDYFRKKGVRKDSNVIFAIANPNLFAVPKYRAALEIVAARREIDCRFERELVEVRSATKDAVFKHLSTGEIESVHYDMLHVAPPMSAPDFISNSLLADVDGWVDVDRETLRHKRFGNVFAIGDCSNLPTSKTAAAIRKQSPVLVANLKAAIQSKPLPKKYNGYTSCPLVTGYGSLILAEFDYDKVPTETFPFDQSKERWSMWLLKRYLLPQLYWRGMLKGRA